MFDWNENDITDTIENNNYKYGNDSIVCILCTVPSKDWQLTMNKFKENDSCMFCFDNNYKDCALLRCNHQYHTKCIIKWCIEKKLNIPNPLKYKCYKKNNIFNKIPNSWEDLIPRMCIECGKKHIIS